MDYSHILRISKPCNEKLTGFGFKSENGVFKLKKNLTDSGFYTEISISLQSITAQVFDLETGERYALFDMPSATGSFVGNLRMQLNLLMEEIQNSCFEVTDVYRKYVDYLLKNYDCTRDFPWDGDNASVVRCKNGKWFALLMNISFKSLGFKSEEKVWVVNLKTDRQNVPSLIDNKSIFPAYHMTKTHWITVLLTDVTDYEQLCKLTSRSYELVDSKISKRNSR